MSAQSTVRDLLREHGPLTVDQLLELAVKLGAVTTKNRKQTIRNAVSNVDSVESGADNRYVYFPRFIDGASVGVPMGLAAPDKGLLVINAETSALLWPAHPSGTHDDSPTIALEHGPMVGVATDYRWHGSLRTVVRLPAEFWQWWSQQGDADALLLSCIDGEAARFSASALPTDALDPEQVAARDAALRETAAVIMHRTRSVMIGDLARRLLSRGIYHTSPPPHPLAEVLLLPGSPFVLDRASIAYRPEITPAMWRLFLPRLGTDLVWDDVIIQRLLGMLPEDEDVDEQIAEEGAPWPEPPPLPEGAVEQGYRLRVRLRWEPKVWRDLEMRGDQTLEDLHLAIQDAFDWDNDHLYAFYLSGKAFDTLTEIGAPTGLLDEEPPLTTEVALAHLDLQPKQKFLYLFDFGDQLEHDVELVGTFTPDPTVTYPRIAEVHGEAPPQYPNWDEWDADDESDEDDEEE